MIFTDKGNSRGIDLCFNYFLGHFTITVILLNYFIPRFPTSDYREKLQSKNRTPLLTSSNVQHCIRTEILTETNVVYIFLS